MADLVAGDKLFVGGGDELVLLLRPGDHGLHALLQIGRRNLLAPHAHGPQSRFVDNVRQFGTRRPGRGARHDPQVNLLVPHVFEMHAENCLASFEVGQLHLNPTVEAPRAQQRLVEALGTVRRSQDHHTLAAVEAVHLGQELVERLLAFVVAAVGAVAPLADGIDLVDEDDAGSLFARLLEEVAHLGRAHADEHLHELRSRNGEKRHLRLSGHGPCDESLAGSRGPTSRAPFGSVAPISA